MPIVSGKNRQLAFALRLEESLGLQLPFQFLEALLQRPLPARLDFRDLQLVLAARLVDGDRAAGEDGLAVAQREADAVRLLPEHDRGRASPSRP